MSEVDYEWAVMYPRQWGDQDPHRTGLTRDEAYDWVAGCIEDGFRTDVFYIARRPIGGWERDGS